MPKSKDEEKGDKHGGTVSTSGNPFHPIVWKLLLMIGVFLYSSYTIFVHLCEVDGQIPFSSASVILLTEFTKLWISVIMLYLENGMAGFTMPNLQTVAPFAIPAVLYTFNNNLAVHMQTQMDPASYQVLGNFKILSTALLYRLIIKKPITGLQWVALGLLALSGGFNSFAGLQAKEGIVSAGKIHVTFKGLVMILVYCLVSGTTGVYSEYILKKRKELSLHMQNALLYIFGVFLNGAAFFTMAHGSGEEHYDLFKGYSIYTWLLILTQAFMGLIMSAILKHGNNITRLFLVSCAMLVTTILSMIIFGLVLNLYFCAAFILVVVALALYHNN